MSYCSRVDSTLREHEAASNKFNVLEPSACCLQAPPSLRTCTGNLAADGAPWWTRYAAGQGGQPCKAILLHTTSSMQHSPTLVSESTPRMRLGGAARGRQRKGGTVPQGSDASGQVPLLQMVQAQRPRLRASRAMQMRVIEHTQRALHVPKCGTCH